MVSMKKSNHRILRTTVLYNMLMVAIIGKISLPSKREQIISSELLQFHMFGLIQAMLSLLILRLDTQIMHPSWATGNIRIMNLIGRRT